MQTLQLRLCCTHCVRTGVGILGRCDGGHSNERIISQGVEGSPVESHGDYIQSWLRINWLSDQM